jgi:hypothetical protein
MREMLRDYQTQKLSIGSCSFYDAWSSLERNVGFANVSKDESAV